MTESHSLDEQMILRLPLPLAQLYRRAHNVRTPLECHQAAWYLWEAALKLLASVAVVEYAEFSNPDPELVERLKNLARPTLGHWWEFIRRLVPVLAERGDTSFVAVRDLVLGRARDDLPRVAGLDAALLEVLEGRGGARSSVRLTELIDHLLQYRNREMGHGVAGQRPANYYEHMARVLLAGATQVLSRLDVLAGRQLLYVGEVRRQTSGYWLVELYALTGESAKRLESPELPEAEMASLPRPERAYLEEAAGAVNPGAAGRLRALHPLLYFEAASSQAYFLNARRGKRGIEYLCYSSGEMLRRDDLGADHRELLIQVIGQPADAASVEAWAALSQVEKPVDTTVEATARRIGDFELLSRLGQGGMGVVYRAWQPSLGRQVALKCMLQAGDPKAEARFSREIRALGRVEHPNVVKVFTSGAEGNQWFYAMELIEGAELSRVCEQLAGSSVADIDAGRWRQALATACGQVRSQERPLDAGESEANRLTVLPAESTVASPMRSAALLGGRYVDQVVEFIRQVAGASHALHEAGVVHRDVKPGNILITADGTQAVLFDLGLAQLSDETEGRVTRTRQFVGTLRYASPEQVLAAGRVDHRTDVYSLGATLGELLTLRPLFDVSDDTPTPELMHRILITDPQSPCKYNRRVPRDVEAIVMKCLEKDKNRRYSTAAELVEDLHRYLEGQPVRARPVTSAMRLWRWGRRRPLSVALIATSLYALVATGMALFVFLSKSVVGTLPPSTSPETGASSSASGIISLREPVLGLMLTAALAWIALQFLRARLRKPGDNAAAQPDSHGKEASPAGSPMRVNLAPEEAAGTEGTIPTKAPNDAAVPTGVDDEAFSPHTVLSRYPAPIAVAYERFWRYDPEFRLQPLFSAAEAAIRYLVTLGVSDLLHCLVNKLADQEEVKTKQAKGERLPEGEKRLLEEKLHLPFHEAFDFLRKPKKNMALGLWLAALRETAGALADQRRCFIPELARYCRAGCSLLQSFQKLVEIRNDCIHPDGTISLSPEECLRVVEKARPLLEGALRHFRFVCNYPLGFVVPRLSDPRMSNHSAYAFHSCMGSRLAQTRESNEFDTPVPLQVDMPFVIAPNHARLLYLWPLLLERRVFENRRTLYAMERIPEPTRRPFLTEVCFAAIDDRDEWRQLFDQTPALSHDWLLKRLLSYPVTPILPPHVRIATHLQPARGDNLVHQILGGNRLEDYRGGGGFGDIYLARTAQGELRAVKVLQFPGSDRHVKRFRQEFEKLKQAAAHPGIIRCRGFGVEKINGKPYPWYSMDYALGGDLAGRIKDRKERFRDRLPWEVSALQAEIVREFEAITEATAHLHRLGIIHRDIKPSNVLIMEDRGLRLSDFGLVKHLEPSEASLQRGMLTSSGAIMGTPPYMAPEQELGLEVDQRADVYALGIVLAELTTGQLPETRTQITSGSTVEISEPLSRLPKPLFRFLLHCTDVDPDRRLKDACEVAEGFEQLLHILQRRTIPVSD